MREQHKRDNRPEVRRVAEEVHRPAYTVALDVPVEASSPQGCAYPGGEQPWPLIERWEREFPLAEGTFGIIAEVNTSDTGTPARSQLVLGSIQQRKVLLLREGHQLQEGLGALSLSAQLVFVPYSQPGALRTVYGDPELRCHVHPIGEAAVGNGRVFRRVRGFDDPWRLHRHQRSPHRYIKREGRADARGITHSTLGEVLATETYEGILLSPHMFVRLVGSLQYSHAIARSFLGRKRQFSPGESWCETGLCYQLLYRPAEM